MSKSNFMIYGVTGYVGELIAREAVRQGLSPIVAGRNSQKVAQLAQELKLEYRIFGLENAVAIDAALKETAVLLNCAGPFVQTAKVLAEACVRNHCHYLDIAGEVPEFETVAAFDDAAKAADIMLMPGVGFGVVPTDCLAVYLKHRLPEAQYLRLAFQTIGGVSRGTLATILPSLHTGGVVRQHGKLQHAVPAWHTRHIAFEPGKATKAVTNPWRADVFTAFYSTAIPNIEAFTAFPSALQLLMKSRGVTGRLLGSSFVQNRIKKLTQNQPAGPDTEARAKGRAFVWGEVEDGQGRKIAARLQTPDAYDVTVLAALAIATKIFARKYEAGFQTPASVFGPELILEIKGVILTDGDADIAPQKNSLSIGTEATINIAASPQQTYAYITTPHNFPPTFKGFGPIPAMSHERLENDATALHENLLRYVTTQSGGVLVEKILKLEPPKLYIYDIVEGIAFPLSLLVSTAHSEWHFAPAANSKHTALRWTYRFELRSIFAYPLTWLVVKIFFARAMQNCLQLMQANVAESAQTSKTPSV